MREFVDRKIDPKNSFRMQQTDLELKKYEKDKKLRRQE